MRLSIVAFGKSKFPFVDEGLEHYFKQIGHSAEIELILLKDQSSDQTKEAALLLDSLAKRKFLDDGKAKVFLLDDKGRQEDSRSFAAMLQRLQDQGVQRFAFAIGGAFGFSEALRQKFPLLSLSKLTFPHDLARLVLAEQLYRALQINQGGKYHHG